MKKTQMKLVGALFLLLVSLVIIVLVWDKFFSVAEGSTAESLCMGFNALRMQTKVDKVVSFNTMPLTCKTIDKVVPSELYDQTEAGAMEEIRDLIAKCWWMFLEGAETNVFAKDWPYGKQPCFTCYRFKVKKLKDMDEISLGDFDRSLTETTYLADIDDDLDNCAPVGGGKCIDKGNYEGSRCDDEDYKELVQAVHSNKCEDDQKCCIKGQSWECVNMGGKCLDLDDGETCRQEDAGYPSQYDKWGCRTGTCCIKEDNYFSYLDYIQKFRGYGKVVYALDEPKFVPEEKQYSISFISPDECGWGCKGFIIATAIAPALTTTVLTGGLGAGTLVLAVAGTYHGATTGSTESTARSSWDLLTKDAELNSILITELDTITAICAQKDDTTGS